METVPLLRGAPIEKGQGNDGRGRVKLKSRIVKKASTSSCFVFVGYVSMGKIVFILYLMALVDFFLKLKILYAK